MKHDSSTVQWDRILQAHPLRGQLAPCTRAVLEILVRQDRSERATRPQDDAPANQDRLPIAMSARALHRNVVPTAAMVRST